MPYVLNDFVPDSERLVQLIVPHIDDDMFDEIALADYGRDQQEHKRELLKIKNGETFAAPMPWHPAEVLELFRWSEPEDLTHKPGREGIGGHWMRAFACAVLLREAYRTENRDFRSSWDSTSIQLVESLRVLGRYHRPALSLLSSLIARFASDPEEEVAILGYAMVGIATAPEAEVADDSLLALLTWADTHGQQEWKENGRDPTEDWLITTVNRCICKETWQLISERLLSDRKSRSSETQAMVASAAHRLAGS